MTDKLDRSSREAIDTFNAINDGMQEVSDGGRFIPRPRLASDVDLSKHDPNCDRCNSGVVRFLEQSKVMPIEPMKPPQNASRKEKRLYKRERRAYNKALKQLSAMPPIPVICNCVVRGGGVKPDQLDRMVANGTKQ